MSGFCLARVVRRSSAMLLAVGLLSLGLGCGDGGGGGDGGGDADELTPGSRAGRLELPAGAGFAATACSVETILGGVAPAADGSFEVPAYLENPTLVQVLSPAGNGMFMAFVDAEHTAINARTTAEALAYFGVGGFLVATPDDRQRLIGFLREADSLEALAETIADAVAADPEALADEDSPVGDAVLAAVAALLREEATRAVLVQPSGARSGVTVNILGANSIQLSNEFRRRTYVWVDRVSYVPAEGGEPIETPLELTEFMLPPVTGLKSTAGTLIDLVMGNVAYAPVTSNTVALPVIPETARKTTYRVTVAGAGANSAGVFADLSAARQGRTGLVAAEQVIFDMFLPLVINVLGPNSSTTQNILEKLRLSGLGGSLVQGFTQAAPDMIRKLQVGDTKGAFLDAYNTFLTDGTLRELVISGLLETGGFIAALDGRSLKFYDAGGKMLRIVKVLDAVLQSFDTLTMGVQLGLSNLADDWTVDVTKPKVRLDPKTKELGFGEAVALTAAVPELAGEDVVLAYQWSTGAAVGTLTDGLPGHENNFGSSRAVATYTAGGETEGSDTVTVEVFQVLPKAEGGRISLGKATATITVVERDERMVIVLDGRLIVCLPDGTQQQELTRDTLWDPAWSPDRRRIAYGSPSGLYVIDADGANRTQLTTFNDSYPSWSPDGREVAVTRGELDGSSSTFSIVAVNVASKAERRLSPLGDSRADYRSTWSPDGQVLVCVSSGNVPDGQGGQRGAVHTALIRAAGGEPQLLFEVLGGSGNLGNYAWEADSQSFVFWQQSHNDPDLDGIWRGSRAGGEPSKLRAMPGLPQDLHWSPLFDRIIFAFADPAVTPSPGWEVHGMPPGGGAPVRLTLLDGFLSDVDW